MHTLRPVGSPKPTTPLRHDGYCGHQREQCWRDECRAEWPDVNTVEVLASGLRLAYCHGKSATPADIRRELWRAGKAAA